MTEQRPAAELRTYSLTVLPNDVFMRLRSAGNILSNIAFNISQGEMSAQTAEQSDAAWKEWDDARAAVANAINLDLGESLSAANLRLEQRVEELEQAAHDALEYFENREDVDDGDYGQPKPSREMVLATALRAAMGLTREGM